jgi:Ice-binding-like/Protein of unknown function (DUF2793)
MSIVPGLKITSLMASAANGDTYGDAERKIFRGIQSLVMPNVVSAAFSAPPITPSALNTGTTYIVGPTPTGLWAGQANALAASAFDPQDGVATTGIWEFYTPQVGWTVFNQATNGLVTWNGTSWAPPVVVPNKTIINPASGAIVFNAALGNSFVADMSGNVNFTITNPTDGQVISILWVQNATGGWSVTYPGNVHSIGFVGGGGVVSPVDLELGTADAYAILAPTVTNTGSSVFTGGNVGATTYTPGGATITPPGVVVSPIAAQAETDLGTAITYYTGLTPTATLTTADIGTSGSQGSVGAPVGNWYAGVYKSPSSIAINSNVVLDAQGNPNAVFVFVATNSTITQAGGTTISLINGAQASNVVWVLGPGGGGSYTVSASATTVGDILASTTITLNGGTLSGRALAATSVVISTATNVTVAGAVPGGAFHSQPSPAPNSVSSQSFTYNAATSTWYQTALGTYGL